EADNLDLAALALAEGIAELVGVAGAEELLLAGEQDDAAVGSERLAGLVAGCGRSLRHGTQGTHAMMSGHARRFPGCAYGPMALRPLMRALQPGERVVAFGIADTAGPGWSGLSALSGLLPIGSVWSRR